MNLRQPMNRRRDSNDQVNMLIEHYNESDERPYRIPWMYDITVTELIELIDQRYELDLSDNSEPLRTVIEDNDCESLVRIYDLYPRTQVVTIRLVHSSIEMIKLLNERFTHICTTLSGLGDCNIERIMDIIDKMIILGSKIELPIAYENVLIRQYIKILKVPVRLTLKTRSYDSEHADIDELVLEADIDSLGEFEHSILLGSAISQGNYYLACHIIDFIDISTIEVRVGGLIGLKCLFDLSKIYPSIIECSNHHNINDLLLELICIDRYLQYCTDPEFDKYLESFDANMLLSITNPNYMKRLRGRVPTCSELIQSINPEEPINMAIINQCIRVIPASDKISYEEGQRIISLIDDSTDQLITLLIEMHIAKIIDLRDYREDHEYVKFIVDRLPVDKSLRVKNARNRGLVRL